METLISADEAIQIAQESPDSFHWLDVRSEGEFSDGSLPLSTNSPILNNQQRHDVGLTYRNRGREAAVRLGHKLVDPDRERLCQSWSNQLQAKSHRFVFCWRGGMRSQITQEWLDDYGVEVLRVEGGYQSIRRRLLQKLEDLPAFLVLSGKTGVQKTRILETIEEERKIDLEKIARHRGSAFGGFLHAEQPSQATFENHLLWKLWSCRDGTVIEDESRMIGRCGLPLKMYNHMAASPRVIVEASLEERAFHIFEEYIKQPLQEFNAAELQHSLQQSLRGIQKKLGWSMYQDLAKSMRLAFEEPSPDLEKHRLWIQPLLERYYDKLYMHSFAQKNCPIVFRGPLEDCSQWVSDFLASAKF